MTKNKPAKSSPNKKDTVTKQVCTVARDREAVYKFWRRFENLAFFMTDLKSITQTSETNSHWIYELPGGKTIEWDAVITEDVSPERIRWETLEGSDFQHKGTVSFLPAMGNQGTEVAVTMTYRMAGGKVGAALAKMLGNAPDQRIQEDLRRFKAVMECGELPVIQGQPMGEASSRRKS
jgi:uncharacterized membrane protein